MTKNIEKHIKYQESIILLAICLALIKRNERIASLKTKLLKPDSRDEIFTLAGLLEGNILFIGRERFFETGLTAI